jgi:hypothetical protein
MNEIVYYYTLIELPDTPIGSQVTISTGFDPCLSVNNIRFPLEFGEKFPNWFHSVIKKEHQQLVKESFIKYAVEFHNKKEEEALNIFKSMK